MQDRPPTELREPGLFAENASSHRVEVTPHSEDWNKEIRHG
jgi:hypothetical protein